MKLQFLKALPGSHELLEDGTPQIAIIGRSNVGKSSVINALAGAPVARISPTPGHTKTINIYQGQKLYLVDLPGYGYAKTSKQQRHELQDLINWYFFDSGINHALILVIVDAKVGLTELDRSMLTDLSLAEKNVLVLANKIDKLKQNELSRQLTAIRTAIAPYEVLPLSALKKEGVKELAAKITTAAAI